MQLDITDERIVIKALIPINNKNVDNL